jgi:beta-ureidopropionase / N-carbamoyl-L-amino-acid hydrolase
MSTSPTFHKLEVNGERLHNKINELAKIGLQPSGAIRRLAFSPEDIQARDLVRQWMVEAGMKVRTDAGGNLIGIYPGIIENAPTLATGSHIDTVPSGGRFDGVLGVLAGIEIVQTLRDNNTRLNHPIEVIVFADEESTMIGCQAMAGTVILDAPERYQTKIGEPIQACLEKIGGNWQDLITAKRSRGDMAAFVELHVEQGMVLERMSKEIGIVEGVVGMRRMVVTITGQANHAGTTPMHMRQDALVAAAKLVLAVQEIALKMPSQIVATVGYLNVAPNAVNIIPGLVELSVDIRDLSLSCLNEMQRQLERVMLEIAEQTDTEIIMKPLLYVEPTPAAEQVKTAIESVCQEMGLPYCHLPSRAGHDALEVGRITDMGMIFVPSQGGISHSESEYTSPEQCILGANVLFNTFIKLD